MRRRNVTYEWLESKADGDLGSIVSIEVIPSRRMIAVCYEGDEDPLRHEGSSAYEDTALTSTD